ncbi:MAG: DUF2723 domain-containing protein [Gemmatimonadetes bacterium]|nr:DUF2723 domain-containing protein [Gemmatimonadota bacterium]
MTDYKPPFRWGIGAGLGVFLLYVLTLSPSTAMWDTSEYIATAHILGIPHPPGNPLFVVLGRVWSVLLAPTGLSVAVRLNLLAAATSAAAAGFYFLVVHRILWSFLRTGQGDEESTAGDGAPATEWTSLIGAGVSVLLSATAFTVWNQSTVNEKVYTISVAIIAAVIWLSLRWMDTREEERGLRYLLGAIYLIALGSTNHLMSVLPLPALMLFVLLVSPAVLVRRKFLVRVVPLVLIGISFNFFLPIRAAQDPVINEGDPTCSGVAEAAVAVFTNGQKGCENLALVLSRFQYQKPPLTDRQAPFGSQLLNYLQYFDWQWARGLDSSEQPRSGRNPITVAFLLLGFWGLWMVLRSDRGAFFLIGGLAATVTLGLVFYLNFKYGYSLAPEVQARDLHEVRERDYFFIASFGLWGVLAGMGLTGAWLRIADTLSGARRHLMAAPVLLVAFIPLGANWVWASRANDYATRDWAFNLLMSVEPYGVIFTNGDNDTFPLWYIQEVEGIRQDVTVVVGQYLYTPWYPRQLQELTSPDRQRPFLPEQGAGIYEPPPTPPEKPIISLSQEEMDQIVGGSFSASMTVPLGPVGVQYPADHYLDRGDQLTLAMIIESFGERPIYFATPSGILGRLGLEPWAVRHGLAAKLVPRDLTADPAPGLVQSSPGYGEDWFDVERTLALLNTAYSYRGLKDRLVWTDRSTLNIPWYFYLTAVQMADVLTRWDGATDEQVEALMLEAESFLVTARGGLLAYSDVEEEE